VHFLCLEPRETDKIVLKFAKNLDLKFDFLLAGSPVNSDCVAVITESDSGVIDISMQSLIFTANSAQMVSGQTS